MFMNFLEFLRFFFFAMRTLKNFLKRLELFIHTWSQNYIIAEWKESPTPTAAVAIEENILK